MFDIIKSRCMSSLKDKKSFLVLFGLVSTIIEDYQSQFFYAMFAGSLSSLDKRGRTMYHVCVYAVAL